MGFCLLRLQLWRTGPSDLPGPILKVRARVHTVLGLGVRVHSFSTTSSL